MPAFTDRFEFRLHSEDTAAEARYPVKAALLVDGGFAVRIATNLAVGVSISRFNRNGSADVTAQIPNPFEFNKFREVTGPSAVLDNTELGYHVRLQDTRPLGRRLRLVLSGGPTYFDVKRQLVSAVQIEEAYPFETATFRSAPASAAKGSGIGFNAGGDLIWTVNRSAGLGVMVRYARASVDFDVAEGSATVDVGGVQATAGLRLYFGGRQLPTTKKPTSK